MLLKDIVKFLNEKIPENLALDFDDVGLGGEYDLNENITSIKIFMDILPEDDTFGKNTLVITHHPPLFSPKTPTYTIHSNWDIIDGGANKALGETLNLNIDDYFDDITHIGRICSFKDTFKNLKTAVLNNFNRVRIVNAKKDNDFIDKVGIVSGFGLKNPEYIKLACKRNLDILISGDLTQETAILAKNLGICLIDLGHHESEIPGLYKLAQTISEISIPIEVIDKKPIEEMTYD